MPINYCKETMSRDLASAVNIFMFPSAVGVQDKYVDRASKVLKKIGINKDWAEWLRIEEGKWASSGEPSKALRDFVELMLYGADLYPKSYLANLSEGNDSRRMEKILKNFSGQYFSLHQKIMKEEQVDHEEAKRILSNSSFTLNLALIHNMTASKIFSVLATQEVSAGTNWTTIKLVLEKSGIRQDVTPIDAEKIFDTDKLDEEALLGGFTVEDAVNHVSYSCEKFGLKQSIEDSLLKLLISDCHPPYLCMLHYQLIIAELYNHRLINAYEFSPRGESVKWLTKQYNYAEMDVGNSPFLNNAKSVGELDYKWASAKKPKERHAAIALVDVLFELDKLSDPARVAICRYLRALLSKVLRLKREERSELPKLIPPLTKNNISNLINNVSLKNTSSYGLIEQRISDVLCLAIINDHENWAINGLGDSVFASNTAKKKLGDIEFKNKHDLKIVAFEAHGGSLSENYVIDHLSSAEKILKVRQSVFEERAPLSSWKLSIKFLAHGYDANLPGSVSLSGVETSIEYMLFSEFKKYNIDENLISLFQKYFTNPLNSTLVSSSKRGLVLNLI